MSRTVGVSLGATTIPILTFPHDEDDMPISVGMDGLLFDGKPFPFATIGPWRIVIADNEATTITVDIAVKLGEIPPDPKVPT